MSWRLVATEPRPAPPPMTATINSWSHRLLVYLNPLATLIDDSRLWFSAAAATLVAVSSQFSSADWRHPFVLGTLALVLAYASALFFGDRPGVRAGAARGIGTAACLLSFQLLLLAVFVPDAAHVDELHTGLDGGPQLNPLQVVLVGAGNALVGWAISSSALPRCEGRSHLLPPRDGRRPTAHTTTRPSGWPRSYPGPYPLPTAAHAAFSLHAG